MSLYFKPSLSTKEAKDGKRKWFPRLVKIGKTVPTRKVAQLIAQRSALTEGDVYNTLLNLPDVLKELMGNGYSVRLEGLCLMRIASQSRGRGVDAPEKVSPTQFTSIRIRFTPETTRDPVQGTTRSLLTGLDFKRVDSITGASAQAGNGDEGNSGGDSGGTNPDDDFNDPTA